MDSTYNNTLQSKTIDSLHRIIISKALAQKDSVTTIANELGFSRQSIHKEIKRGIITKRNSDWTETTYYDCYAAQYAYNASLSNRGRLSKIDDDKALMDFVVEHLKAKNSPEVIESLISANSNFKSKISAKTIYNWVYNGDLGLDHKVLPYGKRKHKKAHKQEKKIAKPNGGESIELRSNIDDRVDFGHWEIDCVVGTRNGKSTSLMTLVERKTRFGIIIRIAKKSKKCIVNALKKIKAKYGKYFYDIFLSITADNGSEFKDALGMSLSLKNGKKIKIYFAHAYSSWERGSNENFNRMIRRWFPKGTSFVNITQQQIDKVCDWINNYPRKQFGFKSASSLYVQEYSKVIDSKTKL
jgi:transposase, IS30 family